jgi:type VI secretion system secreted protein VgrG
LSVTADVIEQFQANHSSNVAQNLYLKATQVVIEAVTGITLKVGGNFITIDMSGIAIQGMPMVQINSAGAALAGTPASLVSPLSPAAATPAGNADPGAVAGVQSGSPMNPGQISPLGVTPATRNQSPTHDPNSQENQDKQHWIEIELQDEDGNPIPGQPYRITLPDGVTVADGTLDEKGYARVDNIDAGTCQVTFPNLDKDTWKRQ